MMSVNMRKPKKKKQRMVPTPITPLKAVMMMMMMKMNPMVPSMDVGRNLRPKAAKILAVARNQLL